MQQPETTVKTYHSAKEFQQDQPKMAQQGWQVISTTSSQPRAGVGRIVTLGVVGATVFKPKPEIIVTYQRDRANMPPPPAALASLGAEEVGTQELFRTRCKQGKLVITDKSISIELMGKRQTFLSRAMLTGVESKVVVPSVMGQGGGANLIFYGQGSQILQADLVNPKVASEIVNALQPRQ